jgi:hypothetical protein
MAIYAVNAIMTNPRIFANRSMDFPASLYQKINRDMITLTITPIQRSAPIIT